MDVGRTHIELHVTGVGSVEDIYALVCVCGVVCGKWRGSERERGQRKILQPQSVSINHID